jgi:hypothetical protein
MKCNIATQQIARYTDLDIRFRSWFRKKTASSRDLKPVSLYLKSSNDEVISRDESIRTIIITIVADFNVFFSNSYDAHISTISFLS